MEKLLSHPLKGLQLVHAAVIGGYHRQLRAGKQRLQRPNTLPDKKIPLNICMKKEEILGRIKHRLMIKITAVLIDFLCFLFTGEQRERDRIWSIMYWAAFPERSGSWWRMPYKALRLRLALWYGERRMPP